MATLKIDKLTTASFDVDVQKTFTPLCPEELPIVGGDLIVSELNKQAEFACLRLGSKDAHSPHAIWIADAEHPMLSAIAGDNVDVRWPLHAVPGTLGFELVSGLPHPKDYDYFVWKGIELDMHPYGACYHDHAERLSTGVVEYLLHNHIKTLIVGGLAIDYCLKTTVLQLRRANFNVIVNLAASCVISEDSSKVAISEMNHMEVKFISSLDELALN